MPPYSLLVNNKEWWSSSILWEAKGKNKAQMVYLLVHAAEWYRGNFLWKILRNLLMLHDPSSMLYATVSSALVV
jgi:hypothetical protein